MKKLYFLSILIALSCSLHSQKGENFQFKAGYIYGTILKHTKHLEYLVKDPVRGTELAIEWQTNGERPWHQYLNFPKQG